MMHGEGVQLEKNKMDISLGRQGPEGGGGPGPKTDRPLGYNDFSFRPNLFRRLSVRTSLIVPF